MAEFTIRWDTAAAERAFAELLKRGQDTAPLMADIGEALIESTQKRFATSTGPDGVPWLPLKSGRRRPLVDTGTLRDEIAAQSGADFVEVFSTRNHAAYHQFGTEPYVIRAKSGRALSWPGSRHPVAKVNHPGLPARPFLGISAEDGQTIEALANVYLTDGG